MTAPKDEQRIQSGTSLIITGGVAGAKGVALLGVMLAGGASGRALDPKILRRHTRPTRSDRGRRANRMAWIGGILGGASLVAGAVMVVLCLRKRNARERDRTVGLQCDVVVGNLQMATSAIRRLP